MKRLMALQFMAAQTWALAPSMLADMEAIARREFTAGRLDALVTQDGESLKAAPAVEVRDGVALIKVRGVISRYATWMHDICGGTSTEALAKALSASIEDPKVRAIVLWVDSPGGMVNGLNEMADMIYQARGQKKISAYVGGMACSAAYWLATACSEVVIDATAELGSVGTVAGFVVRAPVEGEQRIEVVSSNAPNKRLDPTTEVGQQAVRAVVDDLEGVFIDTVARNMGVTRDKVLADFGRGGTFIGAKAVAQGMAHRLGSLEGLIAELSGRKARMQLPTKASTAANTTQGLHTMLTIQEGATAAAVAESLQALHPEAYAAIAATGAAGHAEALATAVAAAKAEGRTEGATAETARVTAVFANALPGHQALIQTLALDGKTTGPEAAAQIIAAERAGGVDYLTNATKTEANKVHGAPESSGVDANKLDSKELAASARALVDAEAAKGNKLTISAAVRQIQKGNA